MQIDKKRTKSYRLIKSLPGLKQGAYIHEDGVEIKILDHDGYVSYKVKPEDHPVWFKPVGKYIQHKGWE